MGDTNEIGLIDEGGVREAMEECGILKGVCVCISCPFPLNGHSGHHQRL
jgi:hypothetical protein